MKNKRIFKTFSALCAALVLMMGLSVTAFAQGTDQPPAEDATNDSNVVVEETEDSPALTPDGNAALVDDFGGNKQLITVTTKAGNYFYILIDRANEDKETAVHFLNQVDEADLMALMEDGQTTPGAARHLYLYGEMCGRCGEYGLPCLRCEYGGVYGPGAGTHARPGNRPGAGTGTGRAEPGDAAGGAGRAGRHRCAGLLQIHQAEAKTKGSDNLDDYDYGEDEELPEDETWETEPEDADGGGDEESEDKTD